MYGQCCECYVSAFVAFAILIQYFSFVLPRSEFSRPGPRNVNRMFSSVVFGDGLGVSVVYFDFVVDVKDDRIYRKDFV